MLTTDAVETFIVDFHAALKEPSPEPAPRDLQAKAKKADGIQHPQMCGASTGTMNVYRINTSDWEKARVLGFVPLCRRGLDR